jgi:hypothetical protein
MATKKTVSKKPATAAKVPTAGTVITFKLVREKTRSKTELLKLGIKAGRVPKFVAALAKYGYVELKA